MTGKDLLQSIENLDGAMIQEAAEAKGQHNKRVFIKWTAAAACFCLVTLGVFGIWRHYGDLPTTDTGDYAVYVPGIELPKGGTTADMIGLIVYKGGIYTHSVTYENEEAKAVKSLVGEYLGYAKGNIDEWSKQSDYAMEFASASMPGNVYAVSGYSTDFRICMTYSSKDDSTNPVETVTFYERLCDIGFNTGKDLFGDRLGLLGNYGGVKYQTHENWDTGYPNYVYHELSGVTDEDVAAFLTELYKAPFVNLTNTDLYDKAQGHLILTMKDGTRVELRLFEGGYVGYAPLGWYCVKMPGDVFDRFYKACR